MPGEDSLSSKARRTPWNKGKLIGAKPSLRPNQVWSIRTRLLIEGRARDLALFNLAIDSKLRGCDVVALRVDDVAPHGYAVDRATVRQKKTGRPVKFELTDQTRQAVDDFLKEAGKRPGEHLFTGCRGRDRAMTTRQYARLLADWVASIGLDPRVFGTHSLRRTKATLIFARGICEPCSACSVTPKSKAQSDISASRLTTRLRLPNRLMSELTGGFCKDPKDGGLNGINFKVVQSTLIGGTFATHWVASAPFLAEPYKGSDAYITKDGLMQAMVTTFDGAALKMKK